MGLPKYCHVIAWCLRRVGGRNSYGPLCHLLTLCLRGEPPFSLSSLFWSHLDTIGGEGGGIRPIAIGHTLQYLVAMCASSRVLPAMGDLLAPLQLGCGMPSGCEAAVHTTHLYIHNMTAGHVLLKLDFKNAFNSVRHN